MNQWFFTGGDFGFFWQEQLASLSWLPTLFRSDIGFGLSYLPNLWLGYPYFLLLKIGTSLGISWWWIEKILWIAVIALGIYSSYQLAAYVFHKKFPAWISSIIYMTNTYILLLLGGRQWGVALAYACSPWVLLQFMRVIDQLLISDCGFKKQNNALSAIRYQDIRQSIMNGVWFGLLVCCDLRLAYLVMGIIILYGLLRIIPLRQGFAGLANDALPVGSPRVGAGRQELRIKDIMLLILHTIGIPLFVTMIMHLFWILPMLFGGLPAGGLGGEEYTNIGMLRFLSVADFSHALSLLHPNWPENLFGKVYFLRPEFLVLPILGFAALLYINNRIADNALPVGRQELRIKNNAQFVMSNQTIILIVYFAIVALIGAFLAKGTQDPFGTIYEWSFYHIPGFVMFRDPTKFYLLIALGYSILIPSALYSLANIELRITDWKKKIMRNALSVIITIVFLCFWCFTLRDIWIVRHMFAPLKLTDEYVQLKDMMVRDDAPYRMLWIPQPDKFFYSSTLHPVLSKDDLWKNASFSAMVQTIEDPSFIKTIGEAGVRYIIIPQDLEKRMFLSDYRFDSTQRDVLIGAVTNTGLSRLSEFQDVVVFENTSYAFTSTIPSYVKKQEYWSRIGLGIGGIGCILFVGIWMVYKKKQ